MRCLSDQIEENPHRALVLGVLNRTPDSFSDGGLYSGEEESLRRSLAMVEEGADAIDVGAESTRPGAKSVSAQEQIRRIGGVIDHLAKQGVVVSIDTSSVEVARFALGEGAAVVNTVDLRSTEALASLCKEHGADLILMHSRGEMHNMPGFSTIDEVRYQNVVTEVRDELRTAAACAEGIGVDPKKIFLDPGLGFMKDDRHSLELLHHVAAIGLLGYSVVVGASRKSFLSKTLERNGLGPRGTTDRLAASLAAAVVAAQGGAKVLRVHDVRETREALSILVSASRSAGSGAKDARQRRSNGTHDAGKGPSFA